MALSPTVVHSPHPFVAGVNRRVLAPAWTPGDTVAELIERAGIRAHQPLVVAIGSRILTREDWGRVCPQPGDLITVRAAVQDGGDSNKVLRSVLTIAIMAAAPGLAAGMLGAGASKLAIGFTAGLISVGGAYLVNAILPPPQPYLGGAQDAESPTYELAGGRNRSRLYEPLPLVIGRHIIFPDLGAREYTEFVGEEQYLYQVFNFGLSDLALSDMRIGQTPLESYEDVETELAGSNGKVTKFPSNVDTVAGAELTYDAGWVTRTSSLDATALAIDLAGLLFYTGDRGLEPRTIIFEVQYRLVGSGTWLNWPDPPASAPPGIQIHSRGREWVAGSVVATQFVNQPRRLWRAKIFVPGPDGEPGSGNDGPAISDTEYWEELTHYIWIRSGSRAPIRRTYRRGVSAGQYEVRVRRSLPDETDVRATSDVSWAQLRTYQPDPGDYSGQVRLAMVAKATGQLSGSVDAFNAIAQAHCEAWNGSAWVRTATSNPAWWFRWMAKGQADANGRRLFGALLPDARIDLEGLKDWGAWCEDKGLQVNLVFDSAMTVDEMLSIIARCGRATVSWATGKLGVVWDAAAQPAVAVFGMGNIVRNSFDVDYATGKLAEEVVGTFINPDLDWQPDTVRALMPGVTTPAHSVSVDLFGVTSREQAGREVQLIAAQQRYRRRRTSWETDQEGLVPQRGDVVILSHDLTRWGYSGRLRRIAPGPSSSTYVTLDRTVPFTPGENHYIGIRHPDGTYDIHDVEYRAGSFRRLRITPALLVDEGTAPHDYTWLFEPLPTPGRRLKIVAVRPKNNGRFQFSAVDDDPAYYAAEDAPYGYTPPDTFGNQYPRITGFSISDTLIRIGNGFGVRVALAWDVEGEYGGAWVRYRLEDAPWTLVGATAGRQIEFDVGADVGALEVEVTAYNRRGRIGPNSHRVEAYSIVGKLAPPTQVTGFVGTATPTGIRLQWDRGPDLDIEMWEVRAGGDWDTGALIVQHGGTDYLYRFSAAGSHTFGIKAYDGERYSEAASYVTVTIASPGAPDVLVTFEGALAAISWTAATSDFPIVAYELRYGATFEGATLIGRVTALIHRQRADWGGTRRIWVVAIDAGGNMGAPGFYDATIEPPAVTSLSHRVIDNFVYLYWAGVPGTLPIERYQVRRGATFAGAVVLGEVGGTFQPHFESVAGEYTYWVAPIDSASNVGAPTGVTARVDQPPDYVLFASIDSDFSGTRDNAHLDEEGLLMPVDTEQTFQEHFDSRSWSSPQDQVSAGFPLFIQPSEDDGYYEETIDYGAILPGTRVSVTPTTEVVAGEPTLQITISLKENIGDPWTDYVGVSEVFGLNYRYVKVRLDVSASGGEGLMRISALNVRLDAKEQTESLRVVAAAGDSGGTLVSFQKSWIDVVAVSHSLVGAAPGYSTFVFLDEPFPTGLRVMAWDTSGNRITRDVSITIRGF